MKKTLRFKNWLQGKLSQRKEQRTQGIRQEIAHNVEKLVHISDVVINGQVVIVLMVGNTVIEWIGEKPKDKDIDGYDLEKSPYRLIQRMVFIRETEYNLICRKEGVA